MGHPLYWILGTVVASAAAGGLAWAVATRRFGRYGPYVAVVAVLAVIWTIWPYWALYRLQTAMAGGDQVTLASAVDWQAVRAGIGDDLKAAYTAKIAAADPRAQQLAQAISASLIDRTVQTQINAGTLAGLAQAGPGVGSNPMENVRYAFFQGSPFIFRVNLGPEGSDVDRQTIYLMEWNRGWQLKRVLVAPYLLKLGG